jgi:hypothetical protein
VEAFTGLSKALTSELRGRERAGRGEGEGLGIEPLEDSSGDGAGTWEADPGAGCDGGEVDERSSLSLERVKPNKERNSLNIPFTVNKFHYTYQYREKGPLGEIPTVRAQELP